MVDKLILRCQAVIAGRFCNKPARWMATWSDREMVVCGDHRWAAQEAHDGNHESDRTGIVWREVVY